MRDTNSLLLDCFVRHADQLSDKPPVDRTPPAELPGVPPRPPGSPASTEVTPWDVLIRQMTRYRDSMSSHQIERIVSSVVDKPTASAADISQLLDLPLLTEQQRSRLLSHRNCNGSRVVEWICATRHDTVVFTTDQMQEQVAMLRNAAGISGEQRCTAWTRLAVRVARSNRTESEFGGLLMASPDASTIVYHVVADLMRSRSQIPAALSRHLLSHLTPINALALLDFASVRHLLDVADRSSVGADRVTRGLTELFVAVCGTDHERWDSVFRLAPRWSGSVNALLDEIDRVAAQLHAQAAYRRTSKSPLLVPGRSQP